MNRYLPVGEFKSNNKVHFNSIDKYIASFPENVQKNLEIIRATIKAAAPDAKERISYQIAAFELNGKNLIYFAGWKKHVSMYPIPMGSEAFNQELSQYTDGKGTVKFPLDKPLPIKLVRQIVKYRLVGHLQNEKLSSFNENSTRR